jgi:hypothetical protein
MLVAGVMFPRGWLLSVSCEPRRTTLWLGRRIDQL